MPSERISSAFSSTKNDLAMADDTDAVGHLLGFLDIMRGQDDGHARFSLKARTTPHMSRRSSTSTPAVGSSRKRISGSCDSALAIMHPALHAAGQCHELRILLVPQRQFFQDLLDMGRVGRLAEEAVD